MRDVAVTTYKEGNIISSITTSTIVNNVTVSSALYEYGTGSIEVKDLNAALIFAGVIGTNPIKSKKSPTKITVDGTVFTEKTTVNEYGYPIKIEQSWTSPNSVNSSSLSEYTYDCK
jgi:hypothetical protein